MTGKHAKGPEKLPWGRPPRHQGERLRKNRTFRVREALDDKLLASAAASGRSVSEEIEFRLEQSYDDRRLGADTAEKAFESMSNALARIEAGLQLIRLIGEVKDIDELRQNTRANALRQIIEAKDTDETPKRKRAMK